MSIYASNEGITGKLFIVSHKILSKKNIYFSHNLTKQIKAILRHSVLNILKITIKLF